MNLRVSGLMQKLGTVTTDEVIGTVKDYVIHQCHLTPGENKNNLRNINQQNSLKELELSLVGIGFGYLTPIVNIFIKEFFEVQNSNTNLLEEKLKELRTAIDNKLGQITWKLDETTETLQDILQCVTSHRAQASEELRLSADCNYQHGLVEEAVSDLRTAVSPRYEQTNFAAHRLLGHILLQDCQAYDEALYHFQKAALYAARLPPQGIWTAARLKVEAAECHLFAGDAAYWNHDLKTALDECEKAIEINPAFMEAYYFEAYCLLHQNDVLTAYSVLEQAINQEVEIFSDSTKLAGDSFYSLALNHLDFSANPKIEALLKELAYVRECKLSALEERRREEREEELKGKEFQFIIITVDAQGRKNSCRRGSARQKAESLGNGVILEMIYIAGDKFRQGSLTTEVDSFEDERPHHSVTIQPFFMGKYPITQAQWQAVTSLPKVNCDLTSNQSLFFKGAKLPVVNVSWYEAVEFCARITKKTGRDYRLPSEAEWEYACRARTTTPFHFGETLTTDLANYNGNDDFGAWLKGKYREQTTEVGSFLPNAFGLYDMHGNVWEWCLDHWHDSYKGAPIDGSGWITGGDSSLRLLRGGSMDKNLRDCRSAARFMLNPESRCLDIGFRVACGSTSKPSYF